MKVDSINNVNFQSKIKMNKFIEEGIRSAQKNIERAEYKSLNKAKEFYDAMYKIACDRNVNEVMFDINHETSEVFAYADGKKVMQYLLEPVIACDGYAASQAVTRYAETLQFGKTPTLMDSYQLEHEIKRREYFSSQENFTTQLETGIKELVKNVTV